MNDFLMGIVKDLRIKPRMVQRIEEFSDQNSIFLCVAFIRSPSDVLEIFKEILTQEFYSEKSS